MLMDKLDRTECCEAIFGQSSTILIKKPRNVAGKFWVADGVRTHDPQNHNLML